MAAGHLNGRRDHDDVLAGNLCRCTGYAPIVRAAQAVEDAPVPDWMSGAWFLLGPNILGGPGADGPRRVPAADRR